MHGREQGGLVELDETSRGLDGMEDIEELNAGLCRRLPRQDDILTLAEPGIDRPAQPDRRRRQPVGLARQDDEGGRRQRKIERDAVATLLRPDTQPPRPTHRLLRRPQRRELRCIGQVGRALLLPQREGIALPRHDAEDGDGIIARNQAVDIDGDAAPARLPDAIDAVIDKKGDIAFASVERRC